MKAKALDTLRARGVQVTAQRLMVLCDVWEHPHASADEVLTRVRAEAGAISRQSVYDSLGVLVGKGILQRIQVAGSAVRFEARVGDNHHHLVCMACEQVVDVDGVPTMPTTTTTTDATTDATTTLARSITPTTSTT